MHSLASYLHIKASNDRVSITLLFIPQVCFSDDFIKSMAGIQNTEFRKQVLSILEKLSGGWRLNGCSRIVNENGAVCQIYEVNGFLRIAWSVDIMTENSEDVQVLKIWDVVPFVEIPKLIVRLAHEFENYTAKTIIQCKYERLEGYAHAFAFFILHYWS